MKQIQLSTFATNPPHCLNSSRTLERTRPKMSSPGDTKDDKQEIFDATSSESSEDGEDTDEDTAEQEIDKEGGDKRGGAPPKKKKRKKLR